MSTADPGFEALQRFHADVDRDVARVTQFHKDALQCKKGCADCCVDDLTVFEVEAARIRIEHADLLRTEAAHPEGACAFLGPDRACRIYSARPYVCRTQGLPLRWWDQDPDGALLEYRDICPLNEDGVDLVQIGETQCWTLGPYEDRLRKLQSDACDGRLPRVRLRDLFRRD